MIFANTNKEITLIYCSKEHLGRQILAYAQAENLPIHDIDLMHVNLTPLHWVELASRLKIEVKDLINTEASDFLQRFGGLDLSSEDDWLKLLVRNPDILKAPIVMKGDKIVQMLNPQEMLYFTESL